MRWLIRPLTFTFFIILLIKQPIKLLFWQRKKLLLNEQNYENVKGFEA